jgi:hypothetical protein
MPEWDTDKETTKDVLIKVELDGDEVNQKWLCTMVYNGTAAWVRGLPIRHFLKGKYHRGWEWRYDKYTGDKVLMLVVSSRKAPKMQPPAVPKRLSTATRAPAHCWCCCHSCKSEDTSNFKVSTRFFLAHCMNFHLLT